MSDDVEQIEQQLEQLDEKSEQYFQKCQIRSAMRIAKEATRTAKSHSLSIHYMRGLFDQMRVGHGMLDPQATREASVELVLMLEDELGPVDVLPPTEVCKLCSVLLGNNDGKTVVCWSLLLSLLEFL